MIRNTKLVSAGNLPGEQKISLKGQSTGWVSVYFSPGFKSQMLTALCINQVEWRVRAYLSHPATIRDVVIVSPQYSQGAFMGNSGTISMYSTMFHLENHISNLNMSHRKLTNSLFLEHNHFIIFQVSNVNFLNGFDLGRTEISHQTTQMRVKKTVFVIVRIQVRSNVFVMQAMPDHPVVYRTLKNTYY